MFRVFTKPAKDKARKPIRPAREDNSTISAGLSSDFLKTVPSRLEGLTKH
jgi:hypothetical protein